MSSYTSSFKALLAALAIIGLVEAGYSAVDASSPAERSSYLNWNFNSNELFHKAVIYEKLRNALGSRPDVIQIGDSSGFHAIVPRIVDQYLGGLKYENLSCCANTSFDGYYTIADFMLRNTSSVKAVVLYIAWNNTPRDPTTVETAVVGGDDRIRNAFGPLAPFMSPSTLAARADVVRPVYTLGHTLNQPGLQPFDVIWPDLTQFLRANRGWWPEHDAHQTAEKQKQTFASFCGPKGVIARDNLAREYTSDVFGIKQSWMQVELRRLADLTARHHAKLILLFQPYPCAVTGDFIPSRRADIAAVQAEYSNVVVPDPALFETWPAQWFTSMDHLRTGHEDAASRRAGRAIAAALGVAPVELSQSHASKAAIPVWSSSNFTAPSWRAEGLVFAARHDGEGVTEIADAGRHYLETTLPDIPAKTYVLSTAFHVTGPRKVYLEIQSLRPPSNYNRFNCSVSALESWRSMGMFDSGIDELSNHTFRCWGKFKLTTSGAIIRIGLAAGEPETEPYQGDEKSSLDLYSVSLAAVDVAEE
jgi:hypothetical protein